MRLSTITISLMMSQYTCCRVCGMTSTGITLGVYGMGEAIENVEYTWSDWNITAYNERLRQVYYGLQKSFGR